MQRLLVYQSLWAMERRRPDGLEWSLDEKLEMIRAAGFDGAGVRFFDRAYAREVTAKLRAWGLSWQAQCYPRTVDELRPVLEHVAEFGADHVNLQADVRPHTVAECVPLIEGWRALARGRRRRAALRDPSRPDDDRSLLHAASARSLPRPAPDRRPLALRRRARVRLAGLRREPSPDASVIDQCWGFHGRVASREQIQVQISFPHQREWLELFMGWWEYGFRSWRRRAPADAV
jgi:hypothetical protein